MSVKVAAIQLDLVYGDKSTNTATLLALIDKAISSGARLVVTPEMGNTGYMIPNPEYAELVAETLDGALMTQILKISKGTGSLICVGFCEIDPNTRALYNSAALVGPDGILLHHRKLHPYVCDPLWAADGDRAPGVVDTDIGRISVAICADVDYPETTAIATNHGAEILALPTCWIAERAPSPVWMARAYESGIYLIAADSCGNESGFQFSGGTSILGPTGSIIASLDTGSGIVMADIDIAALRKARSSEVPESSLGAHRNYPDSARLQTLRLVDRGAASDLLRPTYTWDSSETDWVRRKLNMDPQIPSAPVQVEVAQLDRDTWFGGSASWISQERLAQDISLAFRGASGPRRGTADRLVVLPDFSSTQSSDGESAIPDTAKFAKDLANGIGLGTGLAIAAWSTYCECGSKRQTVNCFGSDGLIGSRVVSSEPRCACGKEPDRLRPFETRLGAIAALWGPEALSPLPARLMALNGAWITAISADLKQPAPIPLEKTEIPHPSPIRTNYDPTGFHLMRQRGAENNTFTAFANTPSPGGFGFSGIFSSELDAAKLLEVSLGPEEVGYTSTTINFPATDYSTQCTVDKPMLKMRRTQHYIPLVSHSKWRQSTLMPN